MRRLALLFGIIALTAFAAGTGVGAAASLGDLGSKKLGATTQVVAACGTITGATYNTMWRNGRCQLEGIDFSFSSQSCLGAAGNVTVQDAAGAVLDTASATAIGISAGPPYVWQVSLKGLPAQDVAKVSVLLNGP